MYWITDCGPVANIVNGAISYSSGTIYGSTVTYSCSDGYEVTGVSSRVCQSSGSWSDSQPECTILGMFLYNPISNLNCNKPVHVYKRKCMVLNIAENIFL